MAVGERELDSMTCELDEMHRQTFPGVHKMLGEFGANLAQTGRRSTGRRRFLTGMGGAVVLGGVAACTSSKSKRGASIPAPISGSSGGKYVGDLKVVALAAALENLAVTVYQGGLVKAAKGQLGTVPPALASFITTAMGQHRDHATAWNGVLTKAGKSAISGAPLTITQDHIALLNAARSVPDLARLALALENAAAETYTFAAGTVTDAGAIMTAATIQPVETMHAAILSFVLGQYPVPVSFIGTSNAVAPSALTA